MPKAMMIAGIVSLLLGPSPAGALPMPKAGMPALPVAQVAERRQAPGTYRSTPPRPGLLNGVPGSLTRRAGYIAFNGYWYPPSAFGSASQSGRSAPQGRPVPQY